MQLTGIKWFIVPSFTAIILLTCLSIALDNASRQAFAPRMPVGDTNAYIDPYTGSFVGIGTLNNDGFDNTPWSNVLIAFRFAPASGYFSSVLENVSVTNPEDAGSLNPKGYEGNAGDNAFTYNVPPSTSLPFAVTKQFSSAGPSNRADNLDYMGTPVIGNSGLNWTGNWKPATLVASFDHLELIKNFTSSVNNQNYTRWAIMGSLVNNQAEAINNVHVVAALYGNVTNVIGDFLSGVAGYGSLGEEEAKMANQTNGPPFAHMTGYEKRNFTLYATIPSDWKPHYANIYAESNETVMYYPQYHPLIADYADKGISYETSQPTISPNSNNTITFTTNITNTSGQDMDFDWVLQIVKTPFNASQGEQEFQWNLGNGTTEHIEIIHGSVKAFNGKYTIQYNWHPSSSGYFAHAIYIVSDLKRPSLLASPFYYIPDGPLPLSPEYWFIYVPP